MKTYTVSYYNKKDNQLITREMRIKAENAKEARAKFDRAYKGAQTGMHACENAFRRCGMLREGGFKRLGRPVTIERRRRRGLRYETTV